MIHDAIVVGGGPAGSTAAWHLAAGGARVLLLEKDLLPRHVVCGEFMSPESTHALEKLGVLAAVHHAGARPVTSALISSSSGETAHVRLEESGISISRHTLDSILLDNVRRAGVTVYEGRAVRDVSGDLDRGFQVSTDQEVFRGRLVIGAFGKRSGLDRSLGRAFFEKTTPYVGVKQHFHGSTCGDAVELHGFEGGYCGLVSVEDGRMNACGLIRTDVLKTVGPRDAIRGLTSLNPILRSRLEGLKPAMERPLAISQVSFEWKDVMSADVVMVGDAAGLITPLCGDGMAMALDGGERAAQLARLFLTEDIDANDLRALYRAHWKQEFATRMKVGRLLQAAFLRDAVTRVGVRAMRIVPSLTGWMIRATRG